MAELMSKRAALPHRVPGARDTYEHGSAGTVSHCQAVLVRTRVKHGNIDPGCLLDDRHEIAKRLRPEMVILAEQLSSLASLSLCGHRSQPRSLAAGIAWSAR